MSTPGGSPASIWINGNIALFVVLVVAAVLLIVTIVTLGIYCCCCRKKIDHWKREGTESKSTNSHVIHVDMHGDSLDADSAVTASVRGPGTFEMQIEQRKKSLYTAPQDIYPQQVVRVEEVQIQHAGMPEPPLTEVRAQIKVEKPVRRDQMEVTPQLSLQTQQQQQEQLKQQPAIEIRNHQRQRLNIYESGINEITIVDSDFSDYEESTGDEAKPKQNSVSNFSWQLLPNHSVQPVPSGANEEPEIVAIDRHGQRYVPEPPPTIEQQRVQRANNLVELDRTLDIFKQQAAAVSAPAVQLEVKLDEDVDEDLVQPIDRSKVMH